MPAGGGAPALVAAVVTVDELDSVIHAPARLRIVATLATLPDDDDLSFTRLQEIIELTPGNLITHLRKLEDAGYVVTHKTGNGTSGRTGVKLTHAGRAALDRYRAVLRELLDSRIAGVAEPELPNRLGGVDLSGRTAEVEAQQQPEMPARPGVTGPA